MAASGTTSLMFINVRADRRSRINRGVCRAIPVAAKLITQCFIVQVDNDPKQLKKVTKGFLQGKKWDILQSDESHDFNPTEQPQTSLN